MNDSSTQSTASLQDSASDAAARSEPDAANDSIADPIQTLPPDLQALIRQGQRLCLMGEPLKARPVFERLEEAIALRGMVYGQAVIKPLLGSAMTNSELGDMESARETIRVCYALASRLKRSDRARAGYDIQAVHIRWHLYAGDVAGAAALCGDAVGIRFTPGPRVDERMWYGIEAAAVFRRMGLHELSLKLLALLLAQIEGQTDADALKMRISILVCRLMILSAQCGLSFSLAGPLGWEACDAKQARADLETSLAELLAATAQAEQAGVMGFARFGRLMAPAFEPSFASDPTRLLDFLADRVRYLRKAGFNTAEQDALIDLAGMQLHNQLYAHAENTLNEARAVRPIDIGPIAAAERWHWFHHLCLRHAGQTERALGAYVDYARSVDARTDLCRRFLAEHLSNFNRAATVDEDAVVRKDRRVAKLALDSLSRSEEDGSFDKTLSDLCETAESPAELAASMGISPRRLQQMFKAWGLPSPARYLRARRAAR